MLGIIRMKGEKFKQNSCLHDYMLENGVVHSLQLICRGMQYAGSRGIAIMCNLEFQNCGRVVKAGLSIVGRKSCLWIMGKRREGGKGIRSGIIRSVLRDSSGRRVWRRGRATVLGDLRLGGRRWRSRGCLEVCRAEHNVSNESSNSN